ncbi:DUF2997 domain-containing protein [Arthrobacter sp. zg-Y820]|uniref:DUF2997 domain-containing protein n=1 Tax=unclassified Arthrobacter TaxID=235627 RepID=UPI001E4BD988|nr:MULTISPECIES: DUF2997 domain-containing protein [unclassified Arthrobacter]MCC9195321.1 DUF2997 domain-containing protein [Arthrobacter sp. zg-Y820]MDK1278180.1 DUF2997 domain-containing protein [Arthrobacter sp. zg.Y820]WIB10066.1 DUF2997 domain-containing protein [Arthrobacter sp. zg-Y820]
MGNEQIIIRVSPDGAIQAETSGIKGTKCLDSIEVLEDLLGAQTVTSSFTKEYEEAPAESRDIIEEDNELRHP